NGSGVSARILASTDHDVFAIEIDDQRASPAPIAVDLRMLRFQSRYLRKPFPATNPHSNVIATGAHTATSALEIRKVAGPGGAEAIVLSQHFREADFFDSSAVAVAVVGRDATADYANEQ